MSENETTSHGIPVCITDLSAALYEELPNELVETIYSIHKTAQDTVRYAVGAVITNAMPKGTFVSWEADKDAYVCYAREADGTDPEGGPFIGTAPTKPDAIAICAALYFHSLKVKP